MGEDLRQVKAPYGKAPMYLLWAAARVAGGVVGIEPFDAQDNGAVRFTTLLGRGISATLGMLTVWVVFCIGRRLGGMWTGVVSAAWLGFGAGHIQQCHYYTVDVSLAFWATLGLYLMLQMPSKRTGLYLACGTVCGLAAGTRLVGMWLGVPFLVAHLWLNREIGRGWWRALATPQTGAYLAAAAAVTLACEPLLLLNPDYFFGSSDIFQLKTSIQVAKGELVKIWTLYDFTTIPYLFYLTHLFRYAMGIPLEVAALSGVLMVFWRREKTGWVMLGWLIPYFLLVGGLHAKPLRYTTPMLPLMAVLGALACLEGACWLRRRWDRMPVYALPVVLVGLPTLGYGVSFSRIYGEEDSRIAAARWIRDHIPTGSAVLSERGGFPTVWMAPEDRYRRRIDDANFYIRTEGCLPYRVQIQFMEEKLTGVDWIVLVEENRMQQYLQVPDRYPIAYGLYSRLASGDLGFEQVAGFKVSPGIPGWSISEDDAEPTITAFDHPRVSIYRRTGDVEGLLAQWMEEVVQDAGLPDRYLREGVEAYHQQEWPRAARAFQRAISTRPNFVLGHLMLMNVYLRQDRQADARQAWNRAMIHHGWIPVEAGVGLIRAGMRVEGLDHLERTLAGLGGRSDADWIAREAAYTRFELGVEYHRQDRYEEAGAEYLRAMELTPDFAPAPIGLGTLYLTQGQYHAGPI